MTATEAAVGKLWQAELQWARSIAAEDNFFELGGDSVLMMIVLFRVGEELGVQLPPDTLLDCPQLGAFCARIDQARGL
jgi:acyl carrier protein